MTRVSKDEAAQGGTGNVQETGMRARGAVCVVIWVDGAEPGDRVLRVQCARQ